MTVDRHTLALIDEFWAAHDRLDSDLREADDHASLTEVKLDDAAAARLEAEELLTTTRDLLDGARALMTDISEAVQKLTDDLVPTEYDRSA